MKGIILAGGSGTRLYPITKAISKQLQPIYDKPMIYYPLSTLMMAGIKDILIITTEEDQNGFKRLLGSGKQYGVNIEYKVQPSPDGLAQAFTLGADFVGKEACAMALGDNIFVGNNFINMLKSAREKAEEGYSTIFGYQVKDPERFGIMEIDNNNKVLSVEEKPEFPKSDYAITGLYFYDNTVVEKASKIEKSARGEYEITDLNKKYLDEGKLRAEILGEGFMWFDTGLPDSTLEAAQYICMLQKMRDGIICCPEQIGYKNGWLSDEELLNSANEMAKNDYGKYLMKTYMKGRK